MEQNKQEKTNCKSEEQKLKEAKEKANKLLEGMKDDISEELLQKINLLDSKNKEIIVEKLLTLMHSVLALHNILSFPDGFNIQLLKEYWEKCKSFIIKKKEIDGVLSPYATLRYYVKKIDEPCMWYIGKDKKKIEENIKWAIKTGDDSVYSKYALYG